MLPIVEYDDMAIVVSQVILIGRIVKNGKKYGFEIYLTGIQNPIVIGSFSKKVASETREEFITIVAQYHLSQQFGPDFDFEEMIDAFDGFEEDDDDDDDDNRDVN